MSNRPAAMIPALLALLPALMLSGWTRAHFADRQAELEVEAAEQEVPSRVVLEVLIAEGGYRLRISEPEREGWEPPLRTARRTRLDGRETFVPRGPGLPAARVLSAAEFLLGDNEQPRVQLRAEDAIPWAHVLEVGEALEPLLGRPLGTGSLLAGMLVDARP